MVHDDEPVGLDGMQVAFDDERVVCGCCGGTEVTGRELLRNGLSGLLSPGRGVADYVVASSMRTELG